MKDFKEIEEEVKKFWKQKKIIEKVRKKNQQSKKKFYFMDGPPYATGHIHMGTALNKILKDIAIRAKRMEGYDVFDRPGYDTHGLPIEFQVEKELGFRNKKEIEKYGVKKFIKKCKKYATRYIDVMNSEFNNLGVWMDWKNPYITLTKEYIEAIWWAFKQAEKKKLLYLGKYPVHVCPRCETAVAYNEIIYKKIDDTAIFVKFPIKKVNRKYLIIWTTTPWTLPGNTAVMVNPKFNYAEVQVEGEKGKEIWIVAKELVDKIMSHLSFKYKIKKVFKGKELEGLEYINPLATNLKLKLKKAYKVVLSLRYVNLEEGTGLVHSAPGHGKEDYEIGKKYGLDMPSPVALNGLLTEEAGKYAGKKARIVDEEIIRDLDDAGMLVFKHKYSHDYPFCWRCKEPLLMIASPQWFFKISKIHKKLLSENKKTNWVPSWMGKRMKAWLSGIGDWPISRQRYWGTPLPIWVCEKCGGRKVIGSVKELEKLTRRKIKELHKPEIDSVVWNCEKCKGKMRRAEEVFDVWFDSGVSSWAALNFPQTKKLFRKFWPADLNLEGTDQFRGWWNSQLILSIIAFNKKPYKNIVVHGMVLDLEKRKMSKSLGNIVTPQEVIEKHGRDIMRGFFALLSRGEDFSYDESSLKDLQKFFIILTNIQNFISQLGYSKRSETKNPKAKKIEDKWILSRFSSVTKQTIESYNKYWFYKALEALIDFTINDFSKTYIKMIREREDKQVREVLSYVYINLLKLSAPFFPHLTEILYKKFKLKQSVHLENFPRADRRAINEKLETEMRTAMRIVEVGLAVRNREGIGLKWPLSSAEITIEKKISKGLEEIIKKQLNIKKLKLEVKKGKQIKVKLNTEITPGLEAEGYAREISRKIQAERKKAGLVKENKIKLIIAVDKTLLAKLKGQEKFIKKRVNAKKISLASEWKERFKNFSDFRIKDKRVRVTFQKV